MGLFAMAEEFACKNVVKDVRQESAAIVMTLCGEIDMSSSRDLRERFFDVLQDSPATLVVNMSEVSFMDSSGLATLVEALHRCRKAQSRLKLTGLCQRVKNIFEISRLMSVFDIYTTEQEALV